jgi:hypothetical protein
MLPHNDFAKVGAGALGAEFTVHATKSVKWPVGRKQGKLALRGRWRLSTHFFEGPFERNKTCCATGTEKRAPSRLKVGSDSTVTYVSIES